MCREFRDQPDASKALVFQYGLTASGCAKRKGSKATKTCLDLPEVMYADAPAQIADEPAEAVEFA